MALVIEKLFPFFEVLTFLDLHESFSQSYYDNKSLEKKLLGWNNG